MQQGGWWDVLAAAVLGIDFFFHLECVHFYIFIPKRPLDDTDLADGSLTCTGSTYISISILWLLSGRRRRRRPVPFFFLFLCSADFFHVCLSAGRRAAVAVNQGSNGGNERLLFAGLASRIFHSGSNRQESRINCSNIKRSCVQPDSVHLFSPAQYAHVSIVSKQARLWNVLGVPSR